MPEKYDDSYTTVFSEMEKLRAELARVTAERDAMVAVCKGYLAAEPWTIQTFMARQILSAGEAANGAEK